MSLPEERPVEQRSSVKIKQNAKGDPIVEVTAYTHDLDKLTEARERAVQTYKTALTEVRE